MKLFVFKRIEQASGNFHPEGGLVVIAESREDILEVVSSDEYISLTSNEISEAIEFELMDNMPSQVFVFPDAGCC